MGPGVIQFLFTSLQLVVGLVLAVHLWRTGLFRIYRALSAYLVFEAVRLLAVSVVPRDTALYGWIYFITQPLLWFITVLMALEVFHNAFRATPGIASASRRLVSTCLAAATIIASLTLALDVRRHSSPYQILEDYLTLERVIYLSLLVFILLLTAALAWFPLPLSRNALTHAQVFTFFFASKAGVILARNVLGPDWNKTGNLFLLGAILASFLLWRLRLSPEGETVSVRSSAVPRTPAQEKRLLDQLERLNQTLGASLKNPAQISRRDV